MEKAQKICQIIYWYSCCLFVCDPVQGAGWEIFLQTKKGNFVFVCLVILWASWDEGYRACLRLPYGSQVKQVRVAPDYLYLHQFMLLSLLVNLSDGFFFIYIYIYICNSLYLPSFLTQMFFGGFQLLHKTSSHLLGCNWFFFLSGL